MNLLQHLESRDLFLAKAASVEQKLIQFTEDIKALTHPQPGTYMLFQHNTATLIRVRQVAVIVERLYDNRTELFKLDAATGSFFKLKGPFPESYKGLLKSSHKVGEQLVLDFQTFLLFTAITLDEWAHCAAYVLGASNPVKGSFNRMVKSNGKEAFSELWKLHCGEALWLDVFIRLFRNKFLVHRERPWQLSYGHPMNSLEWSFWSPLSFGWLDAKKEHEAKVIIDNLAHKIGLSLSGELPRQMSQVLRNIGDIEEKDRKLARDTAAEVGFEMPTFQEIAHRFMDFLIGANVTLSNLAKAKPNQINIGLPSK